MAYFCEKRNVEYCYNEIIVLYIAIKFSRSLSELVNICTKQVVL